MRPATRRPTTRVIAAAFMWVVAAVYGLPVLFLLLMSLRPLGDVTSGLLPSSLRPANFADAMASAPFGHMIVNSLIVAVGATVVQVILSCMAGYSLARLPFRGSEIAFAAVIALIVIPPEVTLVPLFVMVSKVPLVGGNDLFGSGGFGLQDSLIGLMVPHFVSALAIFLLRQFYVSLPGELGDSARMDGASEWRILWRIYTPLAWPAVAVVGIFGFQNAWSDFIWPLIMTQSNETRTVQLGLTVFFQQNATLWPLLMCAVIVVSLPVLILFVLAQRSLRQGILTGAVKQ